MRLIDGDAIIIDLLDRGIEGVQTDDYAEFQQIVADAPTVDAVAVCRCKDCRYSREPNRHDRDENAACEGVLICCVGFDHVYPSSDDGLIFVDKNGYCCHGERKGGDE